MLDELFGVWNRVDRDVFGQLKEKEFDSVEALQGLFPSLRIWQVMGNLLDEIVAPRVEKSGQTAPDAEDRVARESAEEDSADGNATSTSEEASGSAQSTGAQVDSDQDTASTGLIDDRSADSSSAATTSEDSSADGNISGDIEADAIAA